MFIVTGLALPLLTYFGIVELELLDAVLYLHPLQVVLLALRAAVGASLSGWQGAFVLFYSLLSVGIALHLARAMYVRFVRRTTISRARRPA